ncbi:hypothetical protein D3C87_1204370 [compost metagenome]
MRASDLGHGLQEAIAGRSALPQQRSRLIASLGRRQEQVLSGDVGVLECGSFLGGLGEQGLEGGGDSELRTLHLGKALELGFEGVLQGVPRDFEPGEQGDDDALVLGDQGREQVHGIHRRVLMGLSDGLSVLDRLLGFQGETVETHGGLL